MRFGRKEADLPALARNQFLFPVAGFAIGSIVAIIALLLFEFVGGEVDTLLKSLGIVLFLYFLTGLMHIEGLADFGDGLMASGTQERKRQAMKDVSLGASGVFFMLVAVLLLLLLVTHLDGWTRAPQPIFWMDRIPLVFGLILAEISAKLAMITVMTMGPSSHEGMGGTFVSAASAGKLVVGIFVAVFIAFLLSGVYAFLILIGVVVGIIVTVVARRHFGGVGGDSFGAANEFGRILTLLAWVVLI
jgi:adenosylcobinamide-GDP ribazoletransferase